MLKKRLKFILLYTIVLNILFFTVIVTASHNKINKLINLEPFVIPTNNLLQLEDRAYIIVKATILPNSKNIIDNEDNLSIPIGHTKTNIKINEVYKGNLEVNDIITISEPYFNAIIPKELKLNSDEISDGTEYTIAYGNYAPSIVNKEYLFFLSEMVNNEKSIYNETYYIIGGDIGKYITENEVFKETNQNLNIGNLDNKYYIDFFKQVKEKYNIENNNI